MNCKLFKTRVKRLNVSYYCFQAIVRSIYSVLFSVSHNPDTSYIWSALHSKARPRTQSNYRFWEDSDSPVDNKGIDYKILFSNKNGYKQGQ